MEQIVEDGLTPERAALLLAEQGPNLLPVQRAKPVWRRLTAEMVHFFALLFWVAGGLAFVGAVPDAADALDRLTRRGLRVLAIASRDLGLDDQLPSSAAESEQDLRLLGLVALEDPPRPGVDAVLASCRRAGIRVAMVTGDHPETAAAIAREIGLLDAGHCASGDMSWP